MTHHLVGAAEVAELLGISRQRLDRITKTFDDFPEPEVELSAGRVWSRHDIDKWMKKHPQRQAGRPKRA